jgi:hypothetical protein
MRRTRWGRSQIIRRRDSLILYKLFRTLWSDHLNLVFNCECRLERDGPSMQDGMRIYNLHKLFFNEGFYLKKSNLTKPGTLFVNFQCEANAVQPYIHPSNTHLCYFFVPTTFTENVFGILKMTFISRFRIRIHLIRIRIWIQHFRLNTDPDPDLIRIQGFDDQKLKKFTAEKNLNFFE